MDVLESLPKVRVLEVLGTNTQYRILEVDPHRLMGKRIDLDHHQQVIWIDRSLSDCRRSRLLIRAAAKVWLEANAASRPSP